jgi:predicted glycoside hydrolase/deacetylase ChbG (UPF0249 family)
MEENKMKKILSLLCIAALLLSCAACGAKPAAEPTPVETAAPVAEAQGKADNLIAALEEHKDQDLEIMCHPGWCDLELYRKSSYAAGRVQELDVLCSEEVKNYVAENGIELCHY